MATHKRTTARDLQYVVAQADGELTLARPSHFESSETTNSEGISVTVHESECWTVVTATRAGTSRQRSDPCEDSVGVTWLDGGELHVAVADGVSGGARGDLCSAVAVDHLLRLGADRAVNVPQATRCRVESAMESATLAVQSALASEGLHDGATAIVATWLFPDGSGFLAHVGDCRAYCSLPALPLRIEKLTLDHSYANLGVPAPRGVPADAPCRMIGVVGADTAELQDLQLQGGDAMLLLTDGVHGYVPDLAMHHFLLSNARLAAPGDVSGVRRLAEQLVNLALDWDSDDDIGLAVIARKPRNNDPMVTEATESTDLRLKGLRK